MEVMAPGKWFLLDSKTKLVSSQASWVMHWTIGGRICIGGIPPKIAQAMVPVPLFSWKGAKWGHHGVATNFYHHVFFFGFDILHESHLPYDNPSFVDVISYLEEGDCYIFFMVVVFV